MALAALLAVPAMADPVQTFDVNPTLGASQAPGVWYTDRYAPDAFDSVFFDGDNRLHLGIDDSDGASSRPGSFASGFYNTQGRKYDVDTTYMCIDLWIPSETYLDANVGTRFAGFWGTAIDASNVISAYPIVEVQQNGSGDWGFSVWNGATFDFLGLPSGFSYEEWYSLEMVMVGDEVTFNVGDIRYTVDYGNSTQSFTNVILQGYNTSDGVTYDIYWDNFKTEAPVPEPGTLALLSMGVAGMAIRRSRKRA